MPALIGVNEFVSETKDDINSPTTSSFVSRMAHCRQMVSTLEEVCYVLYYDFIANDGSHWLCLSSGDSCGHSRTLTANE